MYYVKKAMHFGRGINIALMSITPSNCNHFSEFLFHGQIHRRLRSK